MKPVFVYLLFIFFNIINSLIFRNNIFDFKSFTYELYKLSVFFFMIPFALLDSKIVLKSVKILVNTLTLFLLLNLIVIFFQQIFGPEIVTKIGIRGETFLGSFKQNHITGLFPGKNINGSINILLFIITLIYSTYKNIFIEYKIYISKYNLYLLQLVSILGIILSESKNTFLAFLLLVGVYIKIKTRYKLTILLSVFILLLIYMYSNDIFLIRSKADGYIKLVENYDIFIQNLSLSERFIEARAVGLLKGILTISNNLPFGTGLGTWGDTSSLLNNYSINYLNYYISSSDSYLIHIMVEQGISCILYFYTVYLLTKNHNKLGQSIFITFFIFLIATMGPSVAITPLFFSFIFSLLISIEKYFIIKR